MNDSVSEKTEINQYLINEINIEIFNKIKKEDHVFKDELGFFNNLCNDFIFFKSNSNNYSNLYSYFKVNNIVDSSRLRFDISNHEHLSPENFEKELLFIRYQIVFYESLLLLVNNEYHIEKRNGVLKQSIGLIGKLIESYVFCQDRIFDIFHNIDMVESFENLIEIIEDIEDIDERITFVNKAKHKYLECDDWFIINENDIPFDIRCDSEIEKLKELKKHLDSGLLTKSNTVLLHGSVVENSNNHIKIVPSSKHGSVFSNNGFVLFEHILNEYVKNERGRLSDIHYFYWAMYNDTDKFIHQRPEPFKEWFFKTYNEDLGKIKTFKQVQNPDREKHYSNALNWFNLLKQ